MWNRLRAAVSRMVVGGSVRGGRDRRRQRQNWSTETVECRCLLSGSAIGDLVQTYPVTVQFSEFGRTGDSRVFGDTLFIPGTRNDGAPVAWTLNQITGVSQEVVFPGSGNISGVIQQNGEFVFTGYKNLPSDRLLTYWDAQGTEHLIGSSTVDIFDVSLSGTIVGTEGYVSGITYVIGDSIGAVSYEVPENFLAFFSITDDGEYLGGGVSDFDLNPKGVVYKRQADGSFLLLNDQFLAPGGLMLERLDVVESPIGVLGVGVYTDLNGASHTGLWKLDGTYLADVGIGFMAGAKRVGNYLFVATDAGKVTAIDLGTFQTQSFSGNTLFGTNVEFMPGSVFATEAGHLGLIGRNSVTGFLTVKTFEVPQKTAPVVSAWDGSTSFVENSLPVVLDANASVVDADSSDFAGGTVTVSFAANGTAADRLSVRHVGNSAGQIGVSGNNISFGGVLIGTKSGGTNGSTPLVVTLNAAANSSAVTALLQAISFQNVSESPSTAARRVQVVVADGDGGTSAAVSKLVNMLRLAPTVSLNGQTVQWTNTGSSSYRVFVQGPSGVVLDESVSGTSKTLSLPPGTYSIWVRGADTAWSTPLRTTIYHPAVTVSPISTLDTSPQIQWSGSAESTYDVWVSHQGQTTALHRQSVTGTSAQLPWMARGRYTVWVRVLNADGTRGVWSAPALLNLGDRPATSLQGATLQWSAFQGASSYELWVELAGTPGRIALNPSSVNGTSVNLSSLGLASGSYRIWIRAVSGGAAGALSASPWSTATAFSV